MKLDTCPTFKSSIAKKYEYNDILSSSDYSMKLDAGLKCKESNSFNFTKCAKIHNKENNNTNNNKNNNTNNLFRFK